MAAPVSVIATTASATGSGSASLGSSPVNRFAVEIDVAQPGDGLLEFDFQVSLDGQTYVAVSPAEKRDFIYVFDVPAQNVKVSFTGNAPGNAVTVTAFVLTD